MDKNIQELQRLKTQFDTAGMMGRGNLAGVIFTCIIKILIGIDSRLARLEKGGQRADN